MKKRTRLSFPLAAAAGALALACGLSACTPAQESTFSESSAASGSLLWPSPEHTPSPTPEGKTPAPSLAPTPTPPPPQSTPPSCIVVPTPKPTPGIYTLTGKLLPFGNDGGLVLSVEDKKHNGLYSFTTDTMEIVGVDDGVLKPGMWVKITYDGEVMTIYPAIISADKVEVLSQEDDNVSLYLTVLERVLDEPDWSFEEMAEHQLTFDFSGLTNLTDSEQSCIAQICTGKYRSIVYRGSREELIERGMLDPETGQPQAGDFVTLSSSEDGNGVLTVKAEVVHQVGGKGLTVTASRDGDGNWVLSDSEEAWVACG